MLRKLNLLFVSVLMTATCAFSQTGLGSVKGTVTDGDTKQPIPFTKVVLLENGTVKGGANTDFDGKFQINSVSPGEYDVEVRNETEGYQPTAITGVKVSSDKITFLDNLTITKAKDVQEVTEMKVVAYRVPLIDKDGGASGATITREDIARLPVRSAAGVAQTVGGVNSSEGDGSISVRGSRSDGTYYYIDGIKVRGSANLPKSAIEEVSVITGGLPANYGDVTGGIISVTTRGPSSKFFGSLEAVSSGFYFNGKDPDGYDGKVFGLDKYAYNLVEGMLSGPLLMKKDSTGAKTKPLLGFLISANYTNELDNRPLNGGSYRIKKDVRDSVLANPLIPNADGTGTNFATNFLRKDDFENTKWRMNARSSSLSAQAKIDVNTGPSVNLTFGGSMNYGNNSLYSRTGSLFNFQNFGVQKTLDYRVFGRLTQRFANDKEGSASKVKSAYYSLMVDYTRTSNQSYDPKHKYNLFNYGHVGTFDSRVDNISFAYIDSLSAVVQQTVASTSFVDFTASESNPGLSAVTSQYYRLFEDRAGDITDNPFADFNTLRAGNALLNGDSPRSVYDIWTTVGTPYNGFGKQTNEQFRVTGSGSVNIGDHSISLGFEYEQRWDRGWTNGQNVSGAGIGPISIWQTARQLANAHISELDLSNPHVENAGAYDVITFDRLNSGYASANGGVYGGAKNGDNQSFFDYNVRKALGLDPGGNDYIQIDAMDPNMFDYSMFSPDELLNNGNSYVSYWGYDHTGEKVKGRTDIDKYFTEYDENGNYKRFVGAYQPIYIAGYLMDKFAFRDIVFNVGVRVDIFDANQPVLKDKYLFYNAKTAGEARSAAGDAGNEWVVVPESIGDDYTVYVNDAQAPTQINGFRSGDTWYDAQGIEVENPALIEGSNGIAPWLSNPNQTKINGSAFEDYKAQVNVMPRIAFSFPVSDESSFFAHYDVLTKRPTTGVRFDPFEYQFIQARSAVINNSNLKPETTVDYELGFQQVVTRTSSLKISAFYREQRNNVQLINVVNAYPATYRTFGNRDFGTVKGLTIAYDLRRTGNIRMTAAYTLQFADGTGSDATSASGLINAGLPNLRAVFPYSFDQRHAFAITMDYRYGSGADYNGPVIKGFNVLENTGLNILSNIYSGSPYSNQSFITGEGLFNPQNAGLVGTTNGSRLPWSYRLDLQLDRTFNLEVGKDENAKRAVFFNVYIRVTNLLNQRNLLNVYRATGNWDDDGYLAAASSQNSIQSQVDEQSFRDYYAMKVQNPFNISAPRTIRLGVKFDF